MPEEFEFQDLSDASFWGVDMRRTTFRDVDLTGMRMSHSRLADVQIDAEIERVVINGVDVTAYVNERDQWFDLRSRIRPTEPAVMRESWSVFVAAWTDTIEQARGLPMGQVHESVDGEWSLVQTVRHLVFATDKWFTVPIAGEAFHPLGLPNSGSVEFPWPGLDRHADPTFEGAVGAWTDRAERLRTHLEHLDPATLGVEVDVLENGPHTVHDCIGVVFEEHFQHLRYARRDIDRLG